MKYVICDPADPGRPDSRPGFAVNDPIEGWIFTLLLPQATRFDTVEAAEGAVRQHYRGRKGLVVAPVSR
jgi:hypothetical protein